jgi:signal transduction histidine kinase
MSRSIWAATSERARQLGGASQLLLGLLALVTLVGPLWVNLLLWRIEYLGYDTELVSGMIIAVAPEGAAAAAGLRPGDQLVTLYDLPLKQIVYHWNLWAPIQQSGAAIPVTVERAGDIIAFALPRSAPEPAYQADKVVFILLAAACWVSGALLGFGRRHEVNGSRSVAVFWLLMAGVLGCYKFAATLSLPFLALLSWLLLTILPPLAVCVHVWFPARAITSQRSRRAQRALIASWSGLNLFIALGWLVWRPEPATMVIYAGLPIMVAFVCAFAGSGLLLLEAYRQVSAPHVRRQIRLLAAACLFTAGVWLIFRLLPMLLGTAPPLPDALIDLTPILIPLAYLVTGTATGLYTLDRIATRIVTEMLVLAAIALIFAGAVVLVANERTEAVIWGALTIGLLLQRTSTWLRQVRARQLDPERPYEPLRRARRLLASSLDLQVLTAAFREGIQATFQQAPFALYVASESEQAGLVLMQQDRLPDLPASLPAGQLLESLDRNGPIVEALQLHSMLAATPLGADEEAAVRHQGVALWCVMRQAQGKIIALALVGTAGNLEPYRAADRRAILELLDAGALAFTNSAVYERLSRTEAARSELFDAMRKVQDETAASIAREIHDEVINIPVHHNIVALQQLLKGRHEPQTRSALELLLASEQDVSERLRIACERLHPTGLDDPLGLVGVQRTRAKWHGECYLRVVGEPVPIEPATQLEVFRIAREAITNAVKHASASTILVVLRFSPAPDGPICLTVEDDGRGCADIQPKAGHWGLRNMHESARVAGGRLRVTPRQGGGTLVSVQFPAMWSHTGAGHLSHVLADAVSTGSF